MLPGFLYFDIRHGLVSDAIAASLTKLVKDFSPIRLLFDSLGLKEVSFFIGEAASFAIKGQILHFYVQDLKVDLIPSIKTTLPKNIENNFLKDCLMGEEILISQLKDLFSHKEIKPTIAVLALKILDEFESDIFINKTIKGHEALWVLCHLAMLLGQIDVLDPKYILSSKPVIKALDKSRSKTCYSITDGYWLHQALKNVPMIEHEDGALTDVLAVSFIKTLAGHYGVRGEGNILHVSVGHGTNGTIEALWCEALLPNSMKECGPNNQAKISFLYQVSGLVKVGMDMMHLSSMLYVIGARHLTWHIVHGENNIASYQVNFVCDESNRSDCLESFLIKGEASFILVSMVEQHMLNQRLVSAPLGKGNKVSSVRFYEYIYFDKTVRVEPLVEDIDAYVQKTGYSVDIARADLLLAWKKWRGRVALDDQA